MKKAMLIIDMPGSCDMCRLSSIAHDSDLYEEGECFCMAKLMSVDDIPDGHKPDWCPLVELCEN